MIFLHRTLTSAVQEQSARIFACCTYANGMFCSKHLLAEALFEKADLINHPEIKEVVCASRGNLSASVALLALRFGVRATLFLPDYATPRNVDLLRLLGAKVHQLKMNKLTEEVAPVAYSYATKDSSRLFLDQFDHTWCSQVYSRVIFSPLSELFPLEGLPRAVQMIVPCGTGSLLIASARFLDGLPGDGHQLVPVFLQEPDASKQELLAKCQSQFPRMKMLASAIPHTSQTLDALRRFSPLFEIPFGLTSADCLAVALANQRDESTREMDLIPILTDSFHSSEITFEQEQESKEEY